MLCRLIGEDIQFEFLQDPSLHPILADPNQIEHAIVNLVVNARDAMPTGGRLTIETSNVVLGNLYCGRHLNCLPGQYVRLAITDTGTGMSEDVRQHVFEPFFTTKAQGRGTGLGLATVYGTVTQVGGSIELYSEPGLGTVLKLYFPCQQAVSDAAKTVLERESQAFPIGSERILFVEDEELVSAMATRVLERSGYRVTTCNSGEEALATVATITEKIDLLVTDVVMPGIDGKVLAETLLRQRPGIRVLYTSGYTRDVVVHHGILERGVCFLSKPYTPQALATKVREILDDKI
jgi:CheY-like chemotaxis protein